MSKRFLKVMPLVLTLATVCAMVTSCSRDPDVRKQKFFESGKRYFDKGKYREAALQFNRALRIDSNFSDAHYQLGLCELKLGSGENAYIELSRTLALRPDNLQAQLDLGNLLLVARESEKATEHADYVLSKDPNNVSAHILKADASAANNQLDSALAEMNTAIQLDPKRSASYVRLGVLESAKVSDSPAAESDFKKAIELDSKAIQAKLELATFYDRSKRFPEAESQLQESLKIAPKNQQVRTALVQHYLVEGQKEAAEKAARDAKAALGTDPDGAQFLARYYVLVNDVKAATAEYQQLTQRFPKDRQIQHAYLDLLFLQGQNDAAFIQANAILKVFSKDSEALTTKGLLLLSKGKASEARDILKSVVKANPHNPVPLFLLGNSFQALGDMAQAEAQWREAAHAQPEYLPPQRALADLAVSKKDFRSLAEIAKVVQEKVPYASDGYQFQAEVDLANNDAKAAEQHLEKAISLNPRSSSLYVRLGQLCMVLHRDADAERNLEAALQIDPQQTLALRALVQLYLTEKQPQRAVQRAQRMVEQFPQNGAAHELLGEVALSQKNLELAESEFSIAVQQMPTDLGTYSNLGAVQVARNEISRAEATYQTAVRNNPRAPGAYALLGGIFEQENKIEDAENSYRKAFELQPDNGLVANNLAYILLERGGNIDQAITYAEMARRQFPNAPAIADTLGWAYYQKGTSLLAVQMLQDAVKGMPASATYHYHLGMAYSKAGDIQRAKSELQKAMQLEVIGSKKDEIRKGLASLS